jgi:hypothetical protein
MYEPGTLSAWLSVSAVYHTWRCGGNRTLSRLKEVAEAMSSWPSVMVDAVKAGPATSYRAGKEITGRGNQIGFAYNFFTCLLSAPYKFDYFQCCMGNPATGDWKVGRVLIASEPR